MDMKFVKNMDLNNEENAMLLKTANVDWDNAVKTLDLAQIKSTNLNEINDASLKVLEAKVNIEILKETTNPDLNKIILPPADTYKMVNETLNTNYPAIQKALGAGKQELRLYVNQAMLDVNGTLRDESKTSDVRGLGHSDYIKLVTDRVIQYVNDKGTDTSSNNNLIKPNTEVEKVDELDTDINKIIGK